MGRVVAVCRTCGGHDVTITMTGEDAWPTKGEVEAGKGWTLKTEIPPQAWRQLNHGERWHGAPIVEKPGVAKDEEKRRRWREQKRAQRARKPWRGGKLKAAEEGPFGKLDPQERMMRETRLVVRGKRIVQRPKRIVTEDQEKRRVRWRKQKRAQRWREQKRRNSLSGDWI